MADLAYTRAYLRGERAAEANRNRMAQLQWEWNNMFFGGYRGLNPWLAHPVLN